MILDYVDIKEISKYVLEWKIMSQLKTCIDKTNPQNHQDTRYRNTLFELDTKSTCVGIT